MRHPAARPATPLRVRGGFTLMEILVALVLIGLLVGALTPTVVNQLGRGEVTRVVDDLGTISTAAQTFRVDVNRHPGDLDDLATSLTEAGNRDVTGSAYPAGLAARWAGPYLEAGGLRSDSTLHTGLGGAIMNGFGTTDWNGQAYLTVLVSGIARPDAEAISLALDGEADVSPTSDAAGQVRWTADETLIYLAVPVR